MTLGLSRKQSNLHWIGRMDGALEVRKVMVEHQLHQFLLKLRSQSFNSLRRAPKIERDLGEIQLRAQ